MVVSVNESLLISSNILANKFTLEELAFIFALRIAEFSENSFNVEIQELFKRFLISITIKCQDFKKVIKFTYT